MVGVSIVATARKRSVVLSSIILQANSLRAEALPSLEPALGPQVLEVNARSMTMAQFTPIP